MVSKPNFSGVIAPVLTPFGEDGSPDPDRFIDHAEWLMENGCTALARRLLPILVFDLDHISAHRATGNIFHRMGLGRCPK